MRYSFDDAAAPSRRTTQYFEILGNRAIYHDGLGRGVLPRPPAVDRGRRPSPFGDERALGALPDRRRLQPGRTTSPPSIPTSCASSRTLFDREARAYDVYPLSDQTTLRALPAQPAQPARGQDAVHALPRPRPACPSSRRSTSRTRRSTCARRCAIPDGRRRGRGHLPGRQHGRLVAVRAGRDARLPLQPLRPRADHASQAPSRCRPATSSSASRFDYDGGGLGKGGAATPLGRRREVAHGRASSGPCRSCSR